MTSVVEILDRVEQRMRPGMGRFYARFEPDPIDQARDELYSATDNNDPEAVVMMAMVFESKINRLADLFDQFQDIARGKPKLETVEDFFYDYSAQGNHLAQLCDECHRSAIERRYLKIAVAVKRDEKGQPTRRAICVCDVCEK